MSELRDKAQIVLYEHAVKNNDGFMSGQVRWILDAMLYFAENKDNLPPAKITQEIKNEMIQ